MKLSYLPYGAQNYIDRSDAVRSMIREKIIDNKMTTEIAQSKYMAASTQSR